MKSFIVVLLILTAIITFSQGAPIFIPVPIEAFQAIANQTMNQFQNLADQFGLCNTEEK